MVVAIITITIVIFLVPLTGLNSVPPYIAQYSPSSLPILSFQLVAVLVEGDH